MKKSRASVPCSGEVMDAYPCPKLILQDVHDSGRRFETVLQGRILVGRDAYQCQIVLRTDSTVARKQCEIYLRDGHIMIHNLSTTNITMVNERQVDEDCPLDSGSVITMGKVKLRVEVHQ